MLILFVWVFHFGDCVDELSTGYANLFQSLELFSFIY